MGKTYNSSSRAVVDMLIMFAPRAGIVRFLVNGVLNTCFGYASFLVALRAGAPLALALIASTVAGTLFNFETSRRIVFQSHEKGRLLAFIGVYAIVFVVDNFAVLAIGTLGLDAAIAQAVVVLPLALLSFTAQRRWVFRREDVR